jgi:hypothetical protein
MKSAAYDTLHYTNEADSNHAKQMFTIVYTKVRYTVMYKGEAIVF